MKNNRTRFMKTFQFVEEQLLSPLSAFEFCDSDLFQETIQSSEVVSTSNYCHGEQSFYTTDLTFPPNITKCPSLVDDVTTTTTNDLPLIFEEKFADDGLSTPLDLTNTSVFTNHQYPNCNQVHYDLSLLQNQMPPTTNNNTTSNDPIFSFHYEFSNDHDFPIIGSNTLQSICEKDNLSSIHPSSSNYSFIDPSINSYLPRLKEGSEIFSENFLLGNDIQTHELEFQGENTVNFCTDPLPHSFNSSELKALSNEDQHLRNNVGSSTSQLAAEIKSMESETFRGANKLTTEERKKKIHKYMMKRNQRNFSKKIKYACRKTLADSRPRVRGRFARNDEFGESNRTNDNHEEVMHHEMRFFHGVVKEEEKEKFESSEIFAQFRGLNSFTYSNYPMKQLI
uniref:uncharacterized protein LOC122582961 n=1 Tax=Erigeron canadensis TaxID=72917 RepID=UPI001CB9088D|nr:uncharacterized protein LOC122582961 [Erigeron canadensis]